MGNDVTDYIRRDAAFRAVSKRYGACRSPAQNRLLDEIRNKIRRMPAADVAPVTRCKDCDAWKRNVGIVDSPNGHCFEHDIDTNGQDFCSYGARKENENG